MINSIKIINFRGIKNAEIHGVMPVNLFFGKNNCGKSSLLEAIFILTGCSNPTLAVITNRSRDYSELKESDLSLFFYNLNTSNAIEMGLLNGENKRELIISTFKPNISSIDIKELSESGGSNIDNSFGLKHDFNIKNGSNNSFTSLLKIKDNDTNATVEIDKKYDEKIIARLLAPKYSTETSFETLAKIIAGKGESKLIEVLKKIDNRVCGINIIKDSIMIDIGVDRWLPINMMGDGIRKILSILIAIEECRNGVLLIDEIDNGLHYSVMNTLWSSVMESAKINNTQIFATTHNIDSIKGLSYAIEQNSSYSNDIGCFKLVRDKEDVLHAIKYNAKQFEYSINNEIEIR